MGYDILYPKQAGTRTSNLVLPKSKPIPLDHSDGSMNHSNFPISQFFLFVFLHFLNPPPLARFLLLIICHSSISLKQLRKQVTTVYITYNTKNYIPLLSPHIDLTKTHKTNLKVHFLFEDLYCWITASRFAGQFDAEQLESWIPSGQNCSQPRSTLRLAP